jgi:hypothetical protein
MVFGDIMPCILVDGHQCLDEPAACVFTSLPKMEAACAPEH